MGSFRRIYIDTNIFIELAAGEGDKQRLLYELVASDMAAGSVFLCTSELTLAELLVHPFRSRNDELVQTYDSWIVPGNSWLDVAAVTRNVLRHAALVRSHYPRVKLADAIHISTAFSFECSHFLTADKNIPEGLQIIDDRGGLAQSSPVLQVVDPSASMLDAIIASRRS